MEEEKEYRTQYRNFMGYVVLTNPLCISVAAIFAALTCVVTMLIAFPIPATDGFINIGDAVVMLAGLLFGPIIGGISGGVGSALADLFLGYTIYAPATLVIKGLEGFIVGMIADPKYNHSKPNIRDIIAVVIGGLIMVFGYFIFEIMIYGVPSAIYEFFLNSIIQFGLGALIALGITFAARRNLVENIPQVFEQIFVT
jgi:uncharacterized membrane protein